MNILFDFISIQGYINGGSEHAKRILHELHSIQKDCNFSMSALFDSKIPFVGNDKNTYNPFFTEWIDINKISTIGRFCKEKVIDVFYIGIGQRLMKYYLEDIECKTVIVIHDIDLVELNNSPIVLRKKLPTHKDILKQYIKKFLYTLNFKKKTYSGDDSESFYNQKNFLLKQNVNIVTVSQFSKTSIQYNFPFLIQKNISIYYSPLRTETKLVENADVKKLVDNNVPYFVSLNAKRPEKNVLSAVNAVRVLTEEYQDYKIVTTGGLPSQHKNHIGLSFVSSGELAYILKHATALIYPTFIEGFGYPPIEAMSYGTPVISSKVASVPEVLGDSAIYFNPMYESELYIALMEFMNSDKTILRSKAHSQFSIIADKQQNDLKSFLTFITETKK